MSNINKHNYEAFYLDYLEGNLSAEATAQLLLFLEKNPLLKAALDDVELLHLTPENISLDKEPFKQHITEENVEEYIIASLENEINEEDAEELSLFLNTSQKASATAARYKKTILPKEVIVYPGKTELKKKKQRAIVYYLTPLASAAAIALIVLLLNTPQQTIDNPVASKKTSEIIKDTSFSSPGTPVVVLEETIKEEEATQSVVKRTTIKPSIKNEPKSAPEVNSVAETLPKHNYVPDVKKDQEKIMNTFSKQVATAAPEMAIDTNTTGFTKNLKDKQNEAILASNTGHSLTLGEWANKTVRQKILKEDAPTTEKVEGHEVLEAVTNKTPIQYDRDETESKKSISISIGKFGFSRTKHQ